MRLPGADDASPLFLTAFTTASSPWTYDGSRAAAGPHTGDFFKAVPEGGDIYFMKHILHDWTDEQATTILRNCRPAMQDMPNASVVLLEFVVPHR
ncbi:MAG: hypothetical protein JO266_21915, partial [Acidobacteria bacterium]|nr:hypothetical protein [Acidobacteriota bacterium]